MQKTIWPMKLVAMTAVLFLALVTLSACEEEGPLEKVGESADEVINDTKRAVQDAKD